MTIWIILLGIGVLFFFMLRGSQASRDGQRRAHSGTCGDSGSGSGGGHCDSSDAGSCDGGGGDGGGGD